MSYDSKLRLGKDLVEESLLFGDFTLRSGQKSAIYFNKYMFEQSPRLLRNLTQKLADLVPQESAVLAGLELGGVPLVTALSLELLIPAAFVRKTRKTYGTCLIAEGAVVAGKRVCVIEDVITTGGQVLSSVADLREEGAVVSEVVCVIFRGNDTVLEDFAKHDLKLKALFTLAELQPFINEKQKRGV